MVTSANILPFVFVDIVVTQLWRAGRLYKRFLCLTVIQLCKSNVFFIKDKFFCKIKPKMFLEHPVICCLQYEYIY